MFRALRGNLESVQRSAAAVNGVFGTLGGVLGGAFATGTLTAFFGAVANSLDRLNDLKDATGASIPDLSALEDVAARTGTSFESMSSTLVRFNKVLTEAEPGSRTEQILKSIGLSAAELRKLDPAEALRVTAVALARYADDGNKARAVQELVGKSIREAAPLLADLAKQTRLVGTVTTEQAEAAEEFNKQVFALSKNSLDLARNIGGPLIGALNSLFESYRRFGGLGGTIKAILGTDETGETEARARDERREAEEERMRIAAGIGIEKRTQETSEFFKESMRNIQDATGDTLLAGLEGRFDDIEDRWKNLLRRMVAEALAARLNEALFGTTGTGGALGGLVGQIFGGARAEGGAVQPHMAYLVGERGPELFVPRAGGHVVSNDELARGGAKRAGPHIEWKPTIHIDSRTDRADVFRLVNESVRRGQEDFARQLSNMGVL